MTALQAEAVEVSNGAERQRRYRERKRQGVVCIVRVPVYCRDVEMLVTHNRLKPEGQNDVAKIVEAVEELVDDFTEERLVTRNNAPGGAAAEAVPDDILMRMAVALGRGLACYVPPTECREAVALLFSELGKDGWSIFQPACAPRNLDIPDSGSQNEKTTLAV